MHYNRCCITILNNMIILILLRILAASFIACCLPLEWMLGWARKCGVWGLLKLCEAAESAVLYSFAARTIRRLTLALTELAEPEKGCIAAHETPRSQDNHIDQTLIRAAELPFENTENYKLVLILDKIRKLEESAFQESRRKCRIQQEIFNLRVRIIHSESQTLHQRRQNLQVMKQSEELSMQVRERDQQIQDICHTLQNLKNQYAQLKALYNNTQPLHNPLSTADFYELNLT